MRRSLAFLWFALFAFLLTACGGGKAPEYKEKTLQERKESFHRDIVTDDLRLFDLRGSVRQIDAGRAVIGFTAGGLLESVVYDGDSLQIVRNSEGEVKHLMRADGGEVPIGEITHACSQRNRRVVYWE
ncbi:MAG: hypothetical protein J6W50_03725 [Bacteroidaceae bacterium]|nr:hypothetical protein [Bacteroidaceae bacterium]MBP5731801.1 hypothetical protein [Bacteroidaceae bacterium]